MDKYTYAAILCCGGGLVLSLMLSYGVGSFLRAQRGSVKTQHIRASVRSNVNGLDDEPRPKRLTVRAGVLPPGSRSPKGRGGE